MKAYLKAAFSISLFQLIFFAALALLKYHLTTKSITAHLQQSIVWVGIICGFVFLAAIGLSGFIENQGQSYEEWKEKSKPGFGVKLIDAVVTWGFGIPVVLFYGLFLLLLAPNSISMAIGLLVSLVLHNSIRYWQRKKGKTQENIAP
jgi:hypothetical protein